MSTEERGGKLNKTPCLEETSPAITTRPEMGKREGKLKFRFNGT
jgi:hypothetical protein